MLEGLPGNTAPRYLPHIRNPAVLAMGLRPLAGPWIEFDRDLPRYLAHKREQRRLRGDAVYRMLPGAEAACAEFATALAAHLEAHPQRPASAASTDAAGEALWDASMQVADDLVVMERRHGSYCLTAASLCSPSHWRLEDKIGRPMAEIHDPIPGIHAALTPKIDRFFDHLKPERPVERFNWAVQGDDALFWLSDHEPALPAGTPLFYRSERQTLSRLPASDAIAFTIRVYVHPLETLAATPGALDSLFAAIDGTPPPLAAYKGFPRLQAALAAYRERFTP